MLRQDAANPRRAAKEIETVMTEFAAQHSSNYDIEFYNGIFLCR